MKITSFVLFACMLVCSSVVTAKEVEIHSLNVVSDKAIQQALDLKLDENTQWWNLLNYRRDFFFWKRSQADSPLFFLSNNLWSPREELIATIRGIFNPNLTRKSPDNALDERVQCFFPGRFLWLQRNLKDIQWPDIKCQRFDNFKGIMSTRSVTYVFSSYYLDNPSSAYGHSFLRLNRADEAKGDKKYELIDFGVGYTAVPTTANTALYALMMAGPVLFFIGSPSISLLS